MLVGEAVREVRLIVVDASASHLVGVDLGRRSRATRHYALLGNALAGDVREGSEVERHARSKLDGRELRPVEPLVDDDVGAVGEMDFFDSHVVLPSGNRTTPVPFPDDTEANATVVSVGCGLSVETLHGTGSGLEVDRDGLAARHVER